MEFCLCSFGSDVFILCFYLSIDLNFAFVVLFKVQYYLWSNYFLFFFKCVRRGNARRLWLCILFFVLFDWLEFDYIVSCLHVFFSLLYTRLFSYSFLSSLRSLFYSSCLGFYQIFISFKLYWGWNSIHCDNECERVRQLNHFFMTKKNAFDSMHTHTHTEQCINRLLNCLVSFSKWTSKAVQWLVCFSLS